jgi:tRNA A-37 threonylcarbamoyl transferase component Bud32
MSKVPSHKAIFLQQNQTADISFPFKIESDALEYNSLVCTRALRFLPGKRLVCQANYGGQNVLAKIFFGADYQRRWSREVKGVGYIHEAGIRTPHLLESVIDSTKKMAIAVFEFIDDVKTFDELRQEGSFFSPRTDFFQAALRIIAKMHDASIYQQDIHLDNFLAKDEKVYLVDGDQVHFEKAASGLLARLAVDNLAMFFTQLYPWQGELIEHLFDDYLAERGENGSGVTLLAVKQKLLKYRAWREKKYVGKKVFRTCSAFERIRNWKTFCIFSREFGRDNATHFIGAPDFWIEKGETLKSGRTATVARINLEGKFYLVKRYNRKSSHHQFARCLLESRSAVSWRNGHLLEFNGVPTARPLLIFERRIGPMRGCSYVLTEYLEGLHAFDYFQKDDCSSDAKVMAEKIVKLIENFHQCMFIHGDLKPHNIWITGNEPMLIDLDGMRKIDDNHGTLVDKDWSRLKRDLGNSEVATILFDK